MNNDEVSLKNCKLLTSSFSDQELGHVVPIEIALELMIMYTLYKTTSRMCTYEH